ncbi:Polynucleotide 5'-hydroxyl-kinase grc3 [Coemansia sp. RSA 518]|nr:Polynucleotide 5'-hydroxyl-kinase grc3 [Coemansia sp. RSA 562]KAJ2174931.1 Polynucleotide 5'-hydroxyl-kinase grc3 [Coemansia sp. RSA 560]KAJ2186768.1 Polynucleotide 5'-hydroxyl-kinase grc3 [Coemansia sp. RSA 532]KAJ2204918.1 Polynucleotide 5'-hydroxyl-kinase grc3 [Coemansia sp. RSA 521]KAJ2227099.1 Polynucleotide 5'-hydroxyl-kinase grc3 [Coemansia sp. RSA 518]KAJ2272463.1 Polynucleotide 5'-hydroxyl-kinase grc3 [Coemansia sp. RSA 371]KAJ2288305.1 Polynucleotide 5'-hydroxyl-kinase grc3 [Coem
MDALASRRSTRVFTPKALRTVSSSQTGSQTGSPTPRTQSPQPRSMQEPMLVTTWDTTMPVVAIGQSQTGELHVLDAQAPISQRHAVVFGMQANDTLVFQGICDICVLKGTVRVYEHESSGQWDRVYSPVSHPLVSLRAQTQTKDEAERDAEAQRMYELWATSHNECEVVVAVRAVDCGLEHLGRVAPAYASLFTGSVAADSEQLVQAIGVPGMTPMRTVNAGVQVLQTPEDWAQALDQASTMPQRLDDEFEPIAPVYAVAGAQGQGKSTFSRMLVNRLVARFGRVFYMETDLGQSEFAAPGALSLTLVSAPVLGPPFTHTGRTEAYHAAYMGVVTPKNDPDRYAACVQRLAQVYRDHVRSERARGSPAVPMVVNTQGWTRGLGLDLLYALCQSVCPTHFVQAYDPATSDASLVDFATVEGCDPQVLWITGMSSDRMQGGDAGDAGESGRRVQKLAAHDMRTLSLLSLMYSAWTAQGVATWNMHKPLAARTPVRVPICDLVFWMGEEDVPPSQVLRAVNGTLVGVVCVARAPGAGAHEWSRDEIRGLYADGVSDQAAAALSEPGARMLLRSHVRARMGDDAGPVLVPQIVYGMPSLTATTFLTHALVRSIDVRSGHVHLVIPPQSPAVDSPMYRVVGIVKGPGPSAFGVDVPVQAMLDGGFAERAMGASSGRHTAARRRRAPMETNVGIQEAPYVSVEVDEGVGASAARARGGQTRRALQ